MKTVYWTYEFGANGYIEIVVSVSHDRIDDEVCIKRIVFKDGSALPDILDEYRLGLALLYDQGFIDASYEALGINPGFEEQENLRREYHKNLL